MAIRIDAAVMSDKGKKRGNNEDSFYLNGQYLERGQMDAGGSFEMQCSDAEQVYAVCDGMGGMDAGEEASSFVAKSLADVQKAGRFPAGTQDMAQWIVKVSDRIYREVRRPGVNPGSTIALLSLKNSRLMIAHVGDSRIYRFRDGQLERMTRDHSVVQTMISAGILTEAEASTHPKRHVITQFLGMAQNEVRVEPTVKLCEDALPGDRYMICSDGLTDLVNDGAIRAVLEEEPTASGACKRLCAAALEAGGVDNVTTLCVYIMCKRIEDDDRTQRDEPSGGNIDKALNAGVCALSITAALTLLDLIVFLMKS